MKRGRGMKKERLKLLLLKCLTDRQQRLTLKDLIALVLDQIDHPIILASKGEGILERLRDNKLIKLDFKAL